MTTNPPGTGSGPEPTVEEKVKEVLLDWWNYQRAGSIPEGLVTDVAAYVRSREDRARSDLEKHLMIHADAIYNRAMTVEQVLLEYGDRLRQEYTRGMERLSTNEPE